MPTRLRKSRKYRGSRTCGWGKVGQHRDQGAKPNRKVGRHKHKWSYVVRYEPDYFGRKGFTSPLSIRRKVKAINVGELDEEAEKLATRKEENKLFIDLENLGYTKLLGGGKVTKPMTVKIAAFSESASQKVKDAGGGILAEAAEKGE
jgi:large subunit ribosomal protein L15